MISKILVNGKSTIPVHHNGESPTNITIAILAKRSLTSMNGGTARNILYIEPIDSPPYYLGNSYLFLITKVSSRATDVYVLFPDAQVLEYHMDENVSTITVEYTTSITGSNTMSVSANGFIPDECSFTVDEQPQQYVNCIFFTAVTPPEV